MNTLTVSSLPLRNVVSDIAQELKAEFFESCGMFYVNLPDYIGSGIISATDFDDGLGLIKYDCTFIEETVFEYTVDKIHPLKFLFCIQGEIEHKFIDEEEWHEISQYKNAIVASSAHLGHCIRFAAGERSIYNSLELDRRKFQSKISCEPVTATDSWRNMLNDVTAKKKFYHEGFYSLKLSEILDFWDTYPNGDWLKKLHLEGIAYKILVLQITQFQDDIRAEGKKTMLRKSELNQLLKAVKIIEDRLENLPTVDVIASEVGLNANKIQEGFKEIFGRTVNLYIREKRMEAARTLIMQTDETLVAITGMVGYKSQSYLSKIFLETYGVQPSEFRKNRERTIISAHIGAKKSK